MIGWYQGRTEFGPRALGARSILASPIHPDMQARLNEIKDREDFRPVAPVVMEEHAADWFVDARVAPFMLFVFDVRDEMKARIPAVTHIDGTARVQTVNRAQHPLYYDLLAAFKQRTGVPVLVNTSFNTRGEPMVNYAARRARIVLDVAARCARHRLVPHRKTGRANMSTYARSHRRTASASERDRCAPALPRDDFLPDVSVVVPTYRRPAMLERCLARLLSRTYDPARYEIIVCDDGPDEATRACVERLAACAGRSAARRSTTCR